MIKHCPKFVALAATLSAPLTLAVGSYVAAVSTASAATVGVNGDIAIAATTYTVGQAAGSVTLTAERRGGTEGALSVTYSTSGGTAVAGKQFTAESGTLTWANGDHANKTFKIPILNTAAYAGDKWFSIKLTAGTQTIVASPSARVYVVGSLSELYSGTVGLTSANYSAPESAGSVAFVAQRSGGTKGAVSFTYKTVNGTAVAGQQFTAETGTLKWADGDGTDKMFKVPLATTAFSGTKSFNIQLAAGAGTTLGSHTSAVVNIVGNAVVTKSIRQWVTCSETVDETAQLEQALLLAANHAFTLIVDCPVRLHTGTAAAKSIAVPDGVTVQFEGAGEFLGVHSGPPALTLAHPSEVSFIDWNYTYL